MNKGGGRPFFPPVFSFFFSTELQEVRNRYVCKNDEE